MRWPDGLDIGISLSGDQCISEIPRQQGIYTFILRKFYPAVTVRERKLEKMVSESFNICKDLRNELFHEEKIDDEKKQ